jgi:hypothetical protein
VLANEFHQLTELNHAELTIVVGIEALEQPLGGEHRMRRAPVGPTSIRAATARTVRAGTIGTALGQHAIAIATECAWWRSIRRAAARTARFAVTTPAAPPSACSVRTAIAIVPRTGTIGSAVAIGWACIGRAARPTIAVAAVTAAISSVRPTSTASATVGPAWWPEFFADRHAELHQFIAVELAVFVVVEQLEQFLPHLRITIVPRRRRITIATRIAGWLGQCRQR